MSYITSPFEVMTILLILCILASVGITTIFNKWGYDLPFKWDIVMGTIATVVLFVLAARAIF